MRTAFVEFRPNAKRPSPSTSTISSIRAALRHRTFFTPNRTNPVPYLTEFRPRNTHADFGLTLKRSF